MFTHPLISPFRWLWGTKTARFARQSRKLYSMAHPSYLSASRSLANRDGVRLLEALAHCEKKHLVAPKRVAEWLESQLACDEGWKQVAEAAGGALLRYPDSAFLLYLRCVGLARRGEYDKASSVIGDALKRHCAIIRARDSKTTRQQAKRLSAVWQATDAVARDAMRWLSEQRPAQNNYSDLDFVVAFESAADLQTDYGTILAYAEPLLQGRNNEHYLARCDLAFEKATTLFQRMRAIRAMWRQGARRIKDYSDGYKLARRRFRDIWPELERVISRPANMPTLEMARHLRSAYAIAQHIGLESEARKLRTKLIAIGRLSTHGEVRFVVINALSSDPKNHALTLDILGDRVPALASELKNYFQWAARMGEFDRAAAVYDPLPRDLQRSALAMTYVNVLHRKGAFAEAEQVCRRAHIRALQRPWEFEAMDGLQFVRRTGEMAFLADTAQKFLSVPQPENPVGVITVMPRTIEQLRRMPLVVLLEFKKMGWAVVCPFEGMLPKQPLGVPALDAMWNTIAQGATLRPGPVKDRKRELHVHADLDHGKLKLGWIDLSHALWEEAAINRRLYEPAYSCPALQHSLSNLAAWSDCTAALLQYAQQELAQLNLRGGVLVSYTARLPDVVVRRYCRAFGDPYAFFCIQANNAYENYFVQFETNTSTRFCMRNMTAHPELRTPALPLVGDVETLAAEIDMSAPCQVEPPLIDGDKPVAAPVLCDEARNKMERIGAWRRRGGKVACAFGKVICDSAVPHDGGPHHKSMKDWINHTIEAVDGSNTLLLIKPHPHENREEIASFLNESFRDLCPDQLPKDNVIYLGSDLFNLEQLAPHIDLGLLYNGTVAIELAKFGIPTIVCAHFAPIDYPVHHTIPDTKEHYAKAVRFEVETPIHPGTRARARAWLHLMSGDKVAIPYRYHSRPLTNVVNYPPRWFQDDFERYLAHGDGNVVQLARQAIGDVDLQVGPVVGKSAFGPMHQANMTRP